MFLYVFYFLSSLLDNGWSNWFALTFEAKLLNDTGIDKSSLALDEIYFMNDCSDLTSERPQTTNTPATTESPLPTVRFFFSIWFFEILICLDH